MNPQHINAQPWPPGQHPAPGPPQRGGFSWATVGVGLIAVAALVVGIVALTKSSSGSTSSPTPITPSSSTPVTETASADRSLCNAIAPLMTESDAASKAYINTGAVGSPERTAATPKYVSDTKDWASRIQPIIDAHPGVDPYFARTLQRFVDDMRLLVTDLDSGGPYQPYDDTVRNDSLAAYTGPLRTCYDLGVRW